MSGGLERYRTVVPDWAEFARVARSAEPTTLRLRRGGGEASEPEGLRREGFELTAVDGMEGFFRVTREPFPISRTLGHWLGDFYIQQASAGVAAPALGAAPGERILDLCAAPGGKTTHLADRMADSGIVVAGDSDTNRIRALLANVYRLSHPNVLAVECDGRSFPSDALFDRVLVDVPCSGEGNVRRHGGEIRLRSSSFTAHITGIQKALLQRALQLVRPGGVVLYVTCTFAPEENEAVVDEVLGQGGAALEPIDLDLPHAPGVTSFEGRSYRDDLGRAWRIYPHHLDSGGLFMARIRRDAGSSGVDAREFEAGVGTGSGARSDVGVEKGGEEGESGGWSPVPRQFPGRGSDSAEGEADTAAEDAAAEERIRRGVRGVEAAFGTPRGLETGPETGRNRARARREPMQWMVRGDSVWAHAGASWPVEAWDPRGDWRVLSLGIRALKRDPRTTYGERPTSDLLRMLGDRLERSVVDLGEEEVLDVLARRTTTVRAVDRGFVAMRFRGRILGRGWVKEGVLNNEISKPRSQRLRADLRSTAKGGPEDV